MFPYELRNNEYVFVCSLPCSSHGAGVPLKASATAKSSNHDDAKVIPKPANLTSHLKTQHQLPWDPELWRATMKNDDIDATKTIQKKAVREKEGLSSFVYFLCRRPRLGRCQSS
jgi:hypothetical protein